MVEPPLPADNVTVLPGTGTESESKRRTVTVAGSRPSAIGDGATAAAVTVDVAASAPVGGGGALPSPGSAPVFPALAATKNGWEKKWGCVKSSWFWPIYSTHSSPRSHLGEPPVDSPRAALGSE